MVKVLVGIQARSTSKRLPGKSLQHIDNVCMIEHVLNAARSTIKFINSKTIVTGVEAAVALLIPYNDPIKEAMAGSLIIEGPEDDVLERFKIAYDTFKPDFIVRLTGDCPLIVPTLITKHINTAIKYHMDYLSNVEEGLRSYVDGYDCEVMSSRAFLWICRNAVTKADREHVTTIIRKNTPKGLKIGAMIGFIDLHDVKLSVDTIDELNRVRENKEAINQMIALAKGKGYAVHRF